MAFLITLVASAGVCVVLADLIRRFPLAFYVAAVALDVLLAAACAGLLPWEVRDALFLLIRKCMVAFALFTVVMFVGALPQGSRLRKRFAPIRGEMSIVACLLALGHAAFYLVSYAPRLAIGGAVGGNVLASFALALVAFALLLVLGATSFRAVKSRMRPDAWKHVQLLAYPFFILVCLHAICTLLPSALAGGLAAMESVFVYGAVLVVYGIARGFRAAVERPSRERPL